MPPKKAKVAKMDIPTPAKTAPSAPAGPSREKLIRLMVGMLTKKGPAMAAQLHKRVENGMALEIQGIKVEVDALEEALAQYEDNLAPEKPVAPEAAAKPVTSSASSWTPAASSSSRWNPGPSSTSLLSARALMECEQAETFNRSVRVVEDEVATVYSKPDVLTAPTGEELTGRTVVDVVARFACQRDGRVYLRLKRDTGAWISTRSSEVLGVEVLEPLSGESNIEPPKFGEPLQSRCLRMLPELDLSSLTPSKGEVVAPTDLKDVGDDDGGVGVGCGEDEFDEGDSVVADEDDYDVVVDHDAEEGEEEAKEMESAEGASEVPDEENACEEGASEVFDEENVGEEGQGQEETGGSAASTAAYAASVKRPRMFKVVAGRCPVLSAPNARELMGSGNKVWLKMNDQFWADAAVFVPSEGRAYVRVRSGNGWIAERSRTDLRRHALLMTVNRRKPLSKKNGEACRFPRRRY